MGYRDDDFVDDDRADAQMRRALQRAHALEQLAPPPDLVARSARRLPSVPPAIAANQIRRRKTVGLIVRLAVVCAVALIILYGLAGLLGAGALVPRLFGDGSAGLSRALLMIQLLAKPLWHTLAAGSAQLVGGVAALAGAAWLWWWSLRRTPIIYAENAP